MRKVFLILLLLSSACGSSPSAPRTPPPPVTRTTDGYVNTYGTTRHPFHLATGGTVTISLNWATSMDLDLYLASVNCVSLYPRSGCATLAQANGYAKPEVVSMQLGAGDYNVFVDNLSRASGSAYTLTVTMPAGNVQPVTALTVVSKPLVVK